MPNNHNNTTAAATRRYAPAPGLPFGMSHVTRADFIEAVAFLYSQYPGIHKARIRHRTYNFDHYTLKLTSRPIDGMASRVIRISGRSVANVVGSAICRIKSDPGLSQSFRTPATALI